MSGMAVQDIGVDVCDKFGDSRLKTSDASFVGRFSNRKSIVAPYPSCLYRPPDGTDWLQLREMFARHFRAAVHVVGGWQ